MIDVVQGKSMIKDVVERYDKLEREHPNFISDRKLTEQDIATKFILPMLEALNWNKLAIEDYGPEVHEKGFRERDIQGTSQEKAKKGGLPDFSLVGPYSRKPFFVEVKHPNIKLDKVKHLAKYRDGDIVFLTSFRESEFVRIGRNGEKEPYDKFIARSPHLYLSRFDNLWQYLSNSKKGEGYRRAVKAWRPGKRRT